MSAAFLSALLFAAAPPADAPLADAVETRDAAAIDRLLDREEPGVNLAQPDGMTALHWAVRRGEDSIVARLINAGADATAETHYGVTPLALACELGDAGIVRRLLDAGADANARFPDGSTPLLSAARTGRPAALKALLEAGSKPNAADPRGQTALMWAAAAGHATAIDVLVAADANVNATLPSGFTPFLFAVREGEVAAARRLLAAGVDVNAPAEVRKGARNGLRNGTPPLALAVENGHFELAAALLNAGAAPDDLRSGFAALHAISWVRKPMRGDGDPAPTGSGSLTSLEFVRVLIDAGADVNLRLKGSPPGHPGLNKKGATAFLLACESCDVPLMTALLDAGADETLTNADGTTALLAAAGVGALGSGDEPAATEAEAVEAVRWLLDRGAKIDLVDDRGETAMHGAAYKNRPDVVRLLAEHGADPAVWNVENRSGWTPLEIASGQRRGNFRPSPETIAAIQAVLARPFTVRSD
ncbi:ankyrin repeat domain-containing protein [Alienimonas chondri]|uniref:Ankyrin repeat domain-containing protein n=1 Tax=Alienimonas chondri TaxID=2681879 RepID=A0ABX1VD54_9PLAN|nr:ankyrin repeat domain-containing protein [Alienimonas chondri]NNJ24976.1 hypothetical protein [Alienimonas chondri]